MTRSLGTTARTVGDMLLNAADFSCSSPVGRFILRAFLTAVIITVTVLAFSASAHAYPDGGSGWPPDIGDTGSTPGTPGTPGCTSNCGGSTTGSTHDVTWSGTCPETGDCQWNNGNIAGVGQTDHGLHIVVTCNAVTIHGYSESPLGYTVWYDIKWSDDGSIGTGYGLGYACTYPVVHDSLVTCAATIKGVITQEVPLADKRNVKSVNQRSAWADDRSNPAKCAGSLTVSPNATMNRLGGYQVAITGKTYPCLLRKATGREDRIVGCGPARVTTQTLKAAVECDPSSSKGWKVTTGNAAWTLPDQPSKWSWAACTSTSAKPVTCDYANSAVKWSADSDPAKPTWMTLAPVQQVMDDGRERVVRFPKFTPKGSVVRILSQVTSVNLIGDTGDERMRYDIKGISPVRPGVSLTASNQPFRVDGLAGPMAGDQRDIGVAWAAPGDGSGFRFSKVNLFSAIVRVQTVEITSIDLDTMTMTTSKVYVNAKAEGLRCQSDLVTFNVLRARNSSG